MNQDTRKALSIAIIFSLMILGVLANTGMHVIREVFSPKPVILQTEKEKLTPALVVPTPNKGYFVECMMDDEAIITTDDNVYHYWCNRGKWEIVDDQNNRNFELPKPQKHNSGTL